MTAIPFTVVGGYLGAGKTTVLNGLLREPGGRRLAVIVNDFGELGIDADRLSRDGDEIVNLANGCVCCTLGDDLHQTLNSLLERSPVPDQIVIEASGVADPRSVAAWGSVAPFEPGGVVVVAAADSVRRMAGDRYVGREVVRQLEAADIVVVSKCDLVSVNERAAVRDWCARTSAGAPSVPAEFGEVPVDLILGLRPLAANDVAGRAEPEVNRREHGDVHPSYSRWSWESERPVDRDALDEFLACLPATTLRLKGEVTLSDGAGLVVDVVGRHAQTRPRADGSGSRLEAIGLGAAFDLVGPGETR